MKWQELRSGTYAVSAGHASTAKALVLPPDFSVLAACAGFFFSSRVAFALVSARWLNIGSEPGVISGFFLAAIVALAALVNCFGRERHTAGRILKLRPIQWVLTYLTFSGCSLLWSASNSVSSSMFYWGALAFDVSTVMLLVRGSGSATVAHSLLKGFIGGSCVLAVVAWLMPATVDLRLGDADYFNTNQIGNLCALSVLMCNFLACRGDRVWRVISWFLILTMFRSLSKATLVAFAASAIYRLLWDASMSRGRKWTLSGAAVVLTIGFWGLLGAYFDVYTTAGNQAETLTGRTAIWAWTLDAALVRPWFGNGFDSMWQVAPPFGFEMFEARHAENELLQQFFAYGVFGILMLFGIYGSFYRLLRKLPQGGERSALTAFLVFVLVRGFAEAEPFDLLLPLWLIATFSILAGNEMQSEQSLEELNSGNPAMRTLPA